MIDRQVFSFRKLFAFSTLICKVLYFFNSDTFFHILCLYMFNISEIRMLLTMDMKI